MSRRGLVIVVTALCALAARAQAADVAAVVQPGDAVAHPSGRILQRALGNLGLEVLGPAEVQRRLRADANASAARGRARQRVLEANTHRRHMQYERAAALAEQAEAEARAGLAELVEPALLAEALLHKGLVLLPTDPPRARRSLLESLGLRSITALDRARYSPKTLEVLSRLEQQQPRTQRSKPASPRRVAAILRARYLLFTSPDGRAQRLQVYDAREQRWRAARSIPAVTPEAALRPLVRGLRRALGLPRPAPRRRSARRRAPTRIADPPATKIRTSTLPWWIAGAGIAAAVTGVTLWVMSSDRARSAEALAGQTPLREYAAGAEAFESSARQLRTGAVVSVSIGAAAVATATGWLLLRGRDDRPRATTRASIGPCGLTVVFP